MCFNNLSSNNLIGLSSSLSIMLSENLTTDEITILAAFFNTLGDNLTIIATKKSIEESSKNNNCNLQ